MSPVISGDEPELKVKAIKELEKRQYLPPGEMELMKMVPGARALSIIRSRRLRKMNSKVYLAAIKELAEFIQITNIDPGREDI